MSRVEFIGVVAFLEAGCGKQLGARQNLPATKEEREESLEVYYSILGGLPVEAIKYAAVEALKINTYPVFPQIGTLNGFAQTWLRKWKVFDEADRLRRQDQRETLSLRYHRDIPSELCVKLKRISIEAELCWPRRAARPITLEDKS